MPILVFLSNLNMGGGGNPTTPVHQGNLGFGAHDGNYQPFYTEVPEKYKQQEAKNPSVVIPNLVPDVVEKVYAEAAEKARRMQMKLAKRVAELEAKKATEQEIVTVIMLLLAAED